MYINNVLYCFYSSDTEALEACFRLLHDDDDDDWVELGLSKEDLYITLKFKFGLSDLVTTLFLDTTGSDW